MSEFQNLVELAYQAAKGGDWARLQQQWSDSPLLLNRCSRFINPGSLWTFLHQAAYFGNEAACRSLVGRGAPLDAVTQNGQTPADVAQQRGHAALSALLRKGSTGDSTLWGPPVDPEVQPSSNAWHEAVTCVADGELFVAYAGGLVRIPQGSRYFADSFGRVLIGWHGTFDPPCGMDGEPTIHER